MATATNFVRGTVIQRSAVQRCAPPAHFVLCDPQTELTLLKLTLRAEDAAATGWRRARVWLWGVWCDRSADAVALGDVVTVRGRGRSGWGVRFRVIAGYCTEFNSEFGGLWPRDLELRARKSYKEF